MGTSQVYASWQRTHLALEQFGHCLLSTFHIQLAQYGSRPAHKRQRLLHMGNTRHKSGGVSSSGRRGEGVGGCVALRGSSSALADTAAVRWRFLRRLQHVAAAAVEAAACGGSTHVGLELGLFILHNSARQRL